MGGSLLARRRLNTTHEAKVRDTLEEEDEELFSGVRALSIRETAPEAKEIPPTDFYGNPVKPESSPTFVSPSAEKPEPASGDAEKKEPELQPPAEIVEKEKSNSPPPIDENTKPRAVTPTTAAPAAAEETK